MTRSSQPAPIVIGATGYLGGHLLRAFRQCAPHAQGTAHRPLTGLSFLDLAAPELDRLELKAGQWAVLAAAASGLRRCHEEPAQTWAVNVDGVLTLTRMLAERGVRPLWFSSDMVFSGKRSPYDDSAPPDPVNEYGRQKAAVESAFAEASRGLGLVVRLSKVYGREPGSRGLLGGMLDDFTAGRPVYAARDLGMNPTHVDDVVECVLHYMRAGRTGVATVCGPAMTRLDIANTVARHAADRLGAEPELVRPTTVDELAEALSEPFQRPKGVRLQPSKDLAGRRFRTIEDELSTLLNNEVSP